MSNDGGPAFPHIERPVGWDANGKTSIVERWTKGGMSLRDYFAGAALQGLLASTDPSRHVTFESYAECAYHHADAMLKARE